MNMLSELIALCGVVFVLERYVITKIADADRYKHKLSALYQHRKILERDRVEWAVGLHNTDINVRRITTKRLAEIDQKLTKLADQESEY